MNNRNRTRTLNDTTFASDPGQIMLSHDKLRVLRPDLYGLRGLWKSSMSILHIGWPERIYIEEQLQNGDSRAAVVVSTFPLLIAAYTDELDCIAMLHFPNNFVRQYHLSDGARLLTVNCYDDSSTYDSDLILGPNNTGQWSGFHPIIAEFVTNDYKRIKARKQKISEDEWQRAYTMGKDYLVRYPRVARDGRPVYSSIPVTIH